MVDFGIYINSMVPQITVEDNESVESVQDKAGESIPVNETSDGTKRDRISLVISMSPFVIFFTAIRKLFYLFMTTLRERHELYSE